jgi:demethylspheroidene O-methyltransferase
MRAAFALRGAACADQLGEWRARLIADPRFQRWAVRSRLTRWLARRRARELFDLCAGFVYSQILAACVELRVFELLRDGPRDARMLAAQMGVDIEAARRLLKAAASLRLLKTRDGDRFGLDDLGAAMIGNPGVAPFVAHHHLLYADLADPVALLRGQRDTELARFWPYAANAPGAPEGPEMGSSAAYSALMSQTQTLVAEAVVGAYPFARHRRLMDVGGGEGRFLEAAAERAPELGLILFDLPSVVARARDRMAARGLSARIELVGGDGLRDSLPRGADIASLVRVLHDHDDESARALLSGVRAALPRGGVLIVGEPMAGVRGAERISDAYFGFYLMAMGRGRTRTPGEIGVLLKQAGFSKIRCLRTPDPMVVSILSAIVV